VLDEQAALDSGSNAGAIDRLVLAQELLLEAVFRSRSAQAVTAALGLTPPGEADRRCGLGHGAVPLGSADSTSPRLYAELDLSPRARELAEALWPDPRRAPSSGELRALLDAWIEAQDGLDRKRNHFLRDFRARHGRGRSEYSPDLARTFDAGLDAINTLVRERQVELARRLIALPAASAPRTS
jgi:hypothetical protein